MKGLSRRFGQVVREKRLERGLTQEKLAELAELDRTFISLIERGHRRLTLESAHQIARALRVSVGVLVSRAEKSGD